MTLKTADVVVFFVCLFLERLLRPLNFEDPSPKNPKKFPWTQKSQRIQKTPETVDPEDPLRLDYTTNKLK